MLRSTLGAAMVAALAVGGTLGTSPAAFAKNNNTGAVIGGLVAGAVIGAAVDHPFAYGEPAVGYPVAPVGWPPLPPGYLAFPSFPGEMPCYLPTGQPYYTPANMPCYPV